jgi:hypothetical protein
VTAAEALAAFEALDPAQRAALTRKARSHATGFRVGDMVTINAPRSPRWHGRTGAVEATNLGEVGVLGAWFRPDELTKASRTGAQDAASDAQIKSPGRTARKGVGIATGNPGASEGDGAGMSINEIGD